MRVARVRNDQKLSYYHLHNRTYIEDKKIFGKEEKNKIIEFFTKLSKFYVIKIIRFCVTDNQWHLIVSVPPEQHRPKFNEMYKRYAEYYGEEKAEKFNWDDEEKIIKLAKRMRNISRLMQTFQQLFASWYNKKHHKISTNKNKKRMWADRFKSTLLEDKDLWDYIKLLDNIPVEAKLCKDPKKYQFCSTGLNAIGKNPFTN